MIKDYCPFCDRVSYNDGSCSCIGYLAANSICKLCSHPIEKHSLGRNHPPFCDGNGGIFECDCEGWTAFENTNKAIHNSPPGFWGWVRKIYWRINRKWNSL